MLMNDLLRLQLMKTVVTPAHFLDMCLGWVNSRW